MKLRLLSFACLSLFSVPSMAAVSCNVTVTPVNVVFSPTVTGNNVTVGSYTVNCNRTLVSDANLNFDLAVNNGLQPNGAQNRVQLAASANRYNYELYRNTTFTNANRWQAANALRFTGTAVFTGASLSAAPVTAPFYVVLVGPQTVRPAGIYTDTATATLRIDGSATVLDSTTFNVQVTTNNSCQFSTTPSPVSLNYVAFQNTASTGSSNFAARCTTALPYSIALDVTSSTLLGLNYTLAISPTGSPAGSFNYVGTGLAQNYTVNVNIPASQAGTCPTGNCTSFQQRTLTISY
jgi:Spore Coat Protein U domain